MANEKSKAEQYRDDRKARIAKSAKKNAHKIEKVHHLKKLVGRIISIVLAVVIGLGAIGLILNYYGVPQRIIAMGSIGSEQKITVAEYEYYYMQQYNSLVNNIQYYSQYYGTDYGYDTTLAPDEQTSTTTDEDGNEITWAELLHQQTISYAQTIKAYYNEALKRDIKLTEDDEKSIDEAMDSYKEQASGSSSDGTDSTTQKYSLNAYLRKTYGNGVNKRFLRKQLEIQTLAQKYYKEYYKELLNGYTDDEIKKVYEADKASYDIVTTRIYVFSNETLEAEDGETDEELEARQTKSDAQTKADAQSFLDKVTNEDTFITQAKALNTDDADYDVNSTKFNNVKSEYESDLSSDVATWAFDSTRKAGDKTLITDEENDRYFVVYFVKEMHQEKTVSVRHILFQTTDSSTGETLSDAEVKAKAEDALKQFNEGTKTEDSFSKLASDLSEDTGSSSNGGLYENVIPGTMTGTFNDWIFDDSRKAGDVEIIKTSYGYHVMYFVSKNKEYYDLAIRSEKAETDIETKLNELIDGENYKAYIGPRLSKYADNRVLKKIHNLMELSSASSTSSSTYSY